jgi:hypothetical protein
VTQGSWPMSTLPTSCLVQSKLPDRCALSRYAMLFFATSAVIVVIFLLMCARAPLWYDEANYLTLSESIRSTGYPVWYWVPEEPKLFLNSPPAVLYFISWLPTSISYNVVSMRLLFFLLFGLTPFVLLTIFALRKNVSLFPVSVTALFAACSGFFLMELIQVRFDLPLACLSCLVMAFYAHAVSRAGSAERNGWLWLSLFSLFALSVLSFLTKFQAVCLTGALFFDVMLTYLLSKSRPVKWLAFCTHLAGIGLAIAILVWWSSSSEYATDAALSNTLKFSIFDRIIPSHDLKKEIIILSSVAKEILVKTIVPMTVLLIACALGRIDWGEHLLRLSVLITLMVVAFDLGVYRMPGAGDYYMIMAVIPLGYILGRSFESLYEFFQRASAVWVLAVLLILHGILNVPPVTRAFVPDVDRLAAEQIARVLRSEDILLLDDESQARAIPFLLHRSDRYGFLLYKDMDVARAENLLQRDAVGRVGALVFTEQSLAKLNSEKWSVVAQLIERKFFRASQMGSFPRLVVFLRRDLIPTP